MVRKAAVSAIVAAFGAAAAPAMAQNTAAPGGTYVQAPWWYVGAGAVFLKRTKGTDVPLLLESADNPPSPNAPVAFSSKQLDTFDPFERGFDIRAGVRATENLWFAGRFVWLGTSKGEFLRFTPAQDFEVPLFNNVTTHFDDIDAAFIRQTSAFHTVGVHAKYKVHRWVSVVGGFRYVNLTENFLMLAVDDGDGDLTKPDNLGTYGLKARNRLFGGEIGLAAAIPVIEGLVVKLEGTAGAFANRISVTHNVSDSDDSRMSRNETNNATRFAFVTTAGASVHYAITRSISVFAGYEMMYLTGLALSQREVNFSSSPAGLDQNVGVRGRGTALYHGGTVGMKLVF